MPEGVGRIGQECLWHCEGLVKTVCRIKLDWFASVRRIGQEDVQEWAQKCGNLRHCRSVPIPVTRAKQLSFKG